MASPSNHRHTVRPLMEATIPRRTASWAMSPQLNREKGKSFSPGSSHARALTSTTTPGGKKTRPAPAGTALQTRQTLLAEPLTPLADDLPGQIQPLGNRGVLQAIGGQQNHLGSRNLAIRCRISSRHVLQSPPLLIREDDSVWAASWHSVTPFKSTLPRRHPERHNIMSPYLCQRPLRERGLGAPLFRRHSKLPHPQASTLEGGTHAPVRSACNTP